MTYIVNLLMHRDYSDGHTSRFIITKDNFITENPCIPDKDGKLDFSNIQPSSKNPNIAKVFREIKFADELGSGMRRLKRYVPVYSDREPVLEEGDIFKVTVPLIEYNVR